MLQSIQQFQLVVSALGHRLVAVQLHHDILQLTGSDVVSWNSPTK
jgi:hypothetical protein